MCLALKIKNLPHTGISRLPTNVMLQRLNKYFLAGNCAHGLNFNTDIKRM